MTSGDKISRGNNITCEHLLIDLNSHIFQKIIRVCRYLYDGFSSGQWKIEKTESCFETV